LVTREGRPAYSGEDRDDLVSTRSAYTGEHGSSERPRPRNLLTPEDAARLTTQLLPDVAAGHPEFFFRPAEQHLLAYMLVNAALKGEREASHLEAFLALEYLPMTDRFKADKAPEVQEHTAYL